MIRRGWWGEDDSGNLFLKLAARSRRNHSKQKLLAGRSFEGGGNIQRVAHSWGGVIEGA